MHIQVFHFQRVHGSPLKNKSHPTFNAGAFKNNYFNPSDCYLPKTWKMSPQILKVCKGRNNISLVHSWTPWPPQASITRKLKPESNSTHIKNDEAKISNTGKANPLVSTRYNAANRNPRMTGMMTPTDAIKHTVWREEKNSIPNLKDVKWNS